MLSASFVFRANKTKTDAVLKSVEQGAAELMQGGEGEFHLRLHAHRAYDTAPEARATTSSRSAVLLMPASPRSTSSPPWPLRARSMELVEHRALAAATLKRAAADERRALCASSDSRSPDLD